MSTSKADIKNSYGVNKEIQSFDEKVAVKCYNGTFVGKEKGKTVEFRGIPFAKSPTGNRRWKKPEPVEDSDKAFEAYYNGRSPIQVEWNSERASYYPQSEDCLYLNIWADLTTKNKTVMVFFHGGSYGWGGTADPLYNGVNLVSAHPDIVLVTVGYRIGLTGFVDFSEVKGGEDFPDAPNLGILDQIEALRWVKKNISAFGGNPDNVTIFGESAGGGSVSLLPIIPEAKGLFNRVIAESGSVALTYSKEECMEYTRKLLAGAKASCMDDLMKLSDSELKKLNDKLDLDNNFPQRDGKLIPIDAYQPYRDGYTKDVDILIGTNSNELNYWIGELGGFIPYRIGMSVRYENDVSALSDEAKKLVKDFMPEQKEHNIWRITEFYNEVLFRLPAIVQAQSHAENGGNAYMYYWKEPSAIKHYGACHAVELAYVFGNLDETIYIGNPADKQLSDKTMDMWTTFAKTGNPSIESLEWKKYNPSDRAAMILEKEPKLEYDIKKDQRRLLMPLLRDTISASYANVSFNVPFVKKALLKIALGVGIISGIVCLIIILLNGGAN